MFKRLNLSPAVTVILVGALANLLLSVIKFVGGLWGHSAALVNDAVHSLSDLLTDVVTLLSHKISNIPRDHNHPYGHGRAENIGAAFIGAMVLLAGAGLLIEAITLITGLHEHPESPNLAALICGLISIVVKEALYWYTRKVGEQENSPSLLANAWHHRSDAVSSIAAVIGIVGAMAGYPIMDPLAAGVVALMIIKVGYNISKEALVDLMDTGLEEEELKSIRKHIEGIPGVIRFHDLRTRRVGGDVFLDVHIMVDKECTVTEGHRVAETVRRTLLRECGPLEDVLVHVDTEDDMGFMYLYPVDAVEIKRKADVLIASSDQVMTRSYLRTHFHKGKVILEVSVRLEGEPDFSDLKHTLAQLKNQLHEIEAVDDVRVYLDPPLN